MSKKPHSYLPVADATHVAVGVILQGDHILIAKRHQQQHQGGLWEFPGGKIEPAENAQAALSRELYEELGIEVKASQPFLNIPFQYADKNVFLHVFKVTDFTPPLNHAYGKEGQQLHWCAKQDLKQYCFPAANKGIIRALCLPQHYLITADCCQDQAHFLACLRASLAKNNIKLMQLRTPSLTGAPLTKLIKAVQGQCQATGTKLLLNRNWRQALQMGLHGAHLAARQIMALDKKSLPVKKNFILGASCHNAAEIDKACQLGIDFITLSPVQQSVSHPQTSPLGWHNFANLTQLASMPVYALGGLMPNQSEQAIIAGAQGIAAISGFSCIDSELIT